MDCSTPGFPVLHFLLDFAQTHVHWVNDAKQASHPLSPPSPLALNFSQHQGLFQWVSSYQMVKVLGTSASASVLPMHIQGWFPLGLTSLISLLSKGPSRVFSNTTVWKHPFFSAQLSLQSNSHIHTGKTIALTRQTFVGKVMSLLFNMLSRLVIAFLPRSKHFLISWLQSPSAVILEPKKLKSDTVSLSISHEVMRPDAMIFVFWMLRFKPTFHSSLSLSSRGFLVPLHFLP